MEMDSERKLMDRIASIMDEMNAYPYTKKIETVQRNGMDIAMFEDQTEELQMIAIMQNPRALEWMKNPSPSVLFLAKLLS